MIVRLDQPYPTVGGKPLRYDFFRPTIDETLPLVVCIHGGGWISGDKGDMGEVARMFAESGFAAACPQYRLAPLFPYPAAVDDVLSFVRFCRTQAEEWKIDPDRIGSFGNSAGGHLAAMTGLLDHPPSEANGGPSGRVDAVVSLCGIFDLTEPGERHFPISMAFLTQFLGSEFEGFESTWREASPLAHVDAEAAPFLVVHGSADDIVPVEQSRAFVKALEQAGVAVEYHELEGEGHAFGYPAWLEIQRWSTNFLEKNLRHGYRTKRSH
ncbi:MAG: alpha/beta hydrolase [Fimbriimonadaceae bacterium]